MNNTNTTVNNAIFAFEKIPCVSNESNELLLASNPSGFIER